MNLPRRLIGLVTVDDQDCKVSGIGPSIRGPLVQALVLAFSLRDSKFQNVRVPVQYIPAYIPWPLLCRHAQLLYARVCLKSQLVADDDVALIVLPLSNLLEMFALDAGLKSLAE
jgi:hypothetical protein